MAPYLSDIWDQARANLDGKRIIVYNAEFDRRILEQSGANTAGLNFECAMRYFSQFVGEWSEWKGEYKWQKLPRRGDQLEKHDAATDCRLTLKVIQHMAETDFPRHFNNDPRGNYVQSTFTFAVLGLIAIVVMLFSMFGGH